MPRGDRMVGKLVRFLVVAVDSINIAQQEVIVCLRNENGVETCAVVGVGAGDLDLVSELMRARVEQLVIDGRCRQFGDVQGAAPQRLLGGDVQRDAGV